MKLVILDGDLDLVKCIEGLSPKTAINLLSGLAFMWSYPEEPVNPDATLMVNPETNRIAYIDIEDGESWEISMGGYNEPTL